MSGVHVRLALPSGEVTALAVVLHGGREHGQSVPTAWHPTVLRMRPFASALRRAGARRGLAVALVRYSQRGWNAPATDSPTINAAGINAAGINAAGINAAGIDAAATMPADPAQPARVHDVYDALLRLNARVGSVPIALVGHSMGGRAALYAGGHPDVRVVVALAPWIEPADPLSQLADRDVLLVHGTADRVTDPRRSERFAQQAAEVGARTSFLAIDGAQHSMLRHARRWHRTATQYVTRTLLREDSSQPAD